MERPSRDGAARHVARAHGEVGAALDRAEQERQLRGIVREIGVDLHEDPVAAAQSRREALAVRGTQPQLAGTLHHVDPAERHARGQRDLRRAVGAGVVHDQDVGVRHRASQPSRVPRRCCPLRCRWAARRAFAWPGHGSARLVPADRGAARASADGKAIQLGHGRRDAEPEAGRVEVVVMARRRQHALVVTPLHRAADQRRAVRVAREPRDRAEIESLAIRAVVRIHDVRRRRRCGRARRAEGRSSRTTRRRRARRAGRTRRDGWRARACRSTTDPASGIAARPRRRGRRARGPRGPASASTGGRARRPPARTRTGSRARRASVRSRSSPSRGERPDRAPAPSGTWRRASAAASARRSPRRRRRVRAARG